MPRLPYTCEDEVICKGLSTLREQLEVPDGFSDEVNTEAEASAKAGPQIPEGSAGSVVADRTDIELVTIDPPDSMDLDQALHCSRPAMVGGCSTPLPTSLLGLPQAERSIPRARLEVLRCTAPIVELPYIPKP